MLYRIVLGWIEQARSAGTTVIFCISSMNSNTVMPRLTKAATTIQQVRGNFPRGTEGAASAD